MFNLGLSELFVLGAIALIVIGPKQLPELARNIARFINEIKRSTIDFRKNFTEIDDLKSAAKEITSVMRNTENWVKDEVQNILVEEDVEKTKLKTGHQENPNHVTEDKEKSTETLLKKTEEPQHEGFAKKNKKEES
ncbi:MAG: twin-arginine translocase TatA/TatE family subunit [Bdellovibrionaceae bacterium]|nr:twin-arginine translocase TatA/TatE family subunit [Pseudobdellovibrionaceae bacterium]